MSSISRLEGKKGEDKYYNDEICRMFDSIPLHNWGGLQDMPQDLVLLKFNISNAVMIWHMVLQKHWVPDLKLLQTCHFNNPTRGSACFRYINLK